MSSDEQVIDALLGHRFGLEADRQPDNLTQALGDCDTALKAMPKPKPMIAIPHYVPHTAEDDIVSASAPQV